MDSDDAATHQMHLDDTDKNERSSPSRMATRWKMKMFCLHDEDERRSRMTTNYISIKNDMTIRQYDE